MFHGQAQQELRRELGDATDFGTCAGIGIAWHSYSAQILSGAHARRSRNCSPPSWKAVQDFTRGAPQADDLTLLLIRYQGAT